MTSALYLENYGISSRRVAITPEGETSARTTTTMHSHHAMTTASHPIASAVAPPEI